MTFLENKYTRWYFALVEKARNRPKPEEYTERHHVLPRCMGGSYYKHNMVHLLAREHYIAHLLLVKMVSDGLIKSKLVFAFNTMDKNGRVKSGRSFQRFREAFRDSITGENHPDWGRKRPCTEARREAIRAAKTGKPNGTKGLKQSPEMVSKRVEKLRANGNYNVSDETKKRMSEAHIGSPSSRAKRWMIIYPDGHTEEVDSLSKFCDNNGLSYACMKSVGGGVNKQHKGFKCVPGGYVLPRKTSAISVVP